MIDVALDPAYDSKKSREGTYSGEDPRSAGKKDDEHISQHRNTNEHLSIALLDRLVNFSQRLILH